MKAAPRYRSNSSLALDMKQALADVESAVGLVDLPEEAEQPSIVRAEFRDGVSNLVLSGPFTKEALRVLAKEVKEDLQRLGVDKIDIEGLPDEVILIEVSETELARLGMSLDQISRAIGRDSLMCPRAVLPMVPLLCGHSVCAVPCVNMLVLR